MADKTKAKTKFSSFEYNGSYGDPLFEPLRIFSALNAVYHALKPWNVSPQDVKYRSGVLTPTDTLVSIEFAKGNYSVNLALASFGFKANFVDWSQAPVIIEIIRSATNALTTALNVTVAEHLLTIVMQLSPEGKSISELTGSLAGPLGPPTSESDFYGFILHSKEGLVVVDKSAADPNDLFVKITRKYSGPHDMEQMAKALSADEDSLAHTLGIEIE